MKIDGNNRKNGDHPTPDINPGSETPTITARLSGATKLHSLMSGIGHAGTHL